MAIERLGPDEGERLRRIRLRALEEAPHAFGTTLAEAARWPASRWTEQVIAFATFVAVVDGEDVGVARGVPHRPSSASFARSSGDRVRSVPFSPGQAP